MEEFGGLCGALSLLERKLPQKWPHESKEKTGVGERNATTRREISFRGGNFGMHEELPLEKDQRRSHLTWMVFDDTRTYFGHQIQMGLCFIPPPPPSSNSYKDATVGYDDKDEL